PRGLRWRCARVHAPLPAIQEIGLAQDAVHTRRAQERYILVHHLPRQSAIAVLRMSKSVLLYRFLLLAEQGIKIRRRPWTAIPQLVLAQAPTPRVIARLRDSERAQDAFELPACTLFRQLDQDKCLTLHFGTEPRTRIQFQSPFFSARFASTTTAMIRLFRSTSAFSRSISRSFMRSCTSAF